MDGSAYPNLCKLMKKYLGESWEKDLSEAATVNWLLNEGLVHFNSSLREVELLREHLALQEEMVNLYRERVAMFRDILSTIEMQMRENGHCAGKCDPEQKEGLCSSGVNVKSCFERRLLTLLSSINHMK